MPPVGYEYHRMSHNSVNSSGGFSQEEGTPPSEEPGFSLEIAFRWGACYGVNYQARSDGKVFSPAKHALTASGPFADWAPIEERHSYAKEFGNYEAGIHWRTRGCLDQLRIAPDRRKARDRAIP
jgi:hypothetical protein